MKNYGNFKDLDKLYYSLFELVYSLKQTGLLRSASILIPYSTQFQLPEALQDVSSLETEIGRPFVVLAVCLVDSVCCVECCGG